jgi:hypothetical protein
MSVDERLLATAFAPQDGDIFFWAHRFADHMILLLQHADKLRHRQTLLELHLAWAQFALTTDDYQASSARQLLRELLLDTRAAKLQLRSLAGRDACLRDTITHMLHELDTFAAAHAQQLPLRKELIAWLHEHITAIEHAICVLRTRRRLSPHLGRQLLTLARLLVRARAMLQARAPGVQLWRVLRLLILYDKQMKHLTPLLVAAGVPAGDLAHEASEGEHVTLRLYQILKGGRGAPL